MATKNDSPKAGIRTTEFWITVIVASASLAWGAGLINPDGSTGADKVFGFIVSALSALGYTVSRGLAKATKKP